MKKYFNYLFVAIILVGLPLYAWYFLTKGTQMRKDAMSDLEPKFQIGNFQSVTDADSLFYSESFLGKKWIVGIIAADSLRDKHVEIVKDLYQQSKDEFSSNIFTIIGLHSGELIVDMGKHFALPYDANWIKTYMAAKHIFLFSNEAFSIPESKSNQSLVVFIDNQGMTRQYYTLSDGEDVKKMARQLPVFLSLKK